MSTRNPDEYPEEFHRDRHEHGGAKQRLDQDRLEALTEAERVDAGLDDFDPNEVPPATDVAPQPTDIRDTEAYEAGRAELIREIDEGEFRNPSPRDPFPPTRYEDD